METLLFDLIFGLLYMLYRMTMALGRGTRRLARRILSPAEIVPEPRLLAVKNPENVKCPYCHGPLVETDRRGNSRPIAVCDECSTGHHPDCWREHQKCAIYACGHGSHSRLLAGGSPERMRIVVSPRTSPPVFGLPQTRR